MIPASLRKILDAKKPKTPGVQVIVTPPGVDETIIWRDGTIYKNGKLMPHKCEKYKA